MTSVPLPLSQALVSPDGKGRAWVLAEKQTVITQVIGDTMTRVTADFFAHTVDEVARTTGVPMTFLQEWTDCQTYELEARSLILAWGRRARPYIREVVVAISPASPAYLRIAVTTGITLLRLGGLKISLVDDLSSHFSAL